jgi:hypothetical protein
MTTKPPTTTPMMIWFEVLSPVPFDRCSTAMTGEGLIPNIVAPRIGLNILIDCCLDIAAFQNGNNATVAPVIAILRRPFQPPLLSIAPRAVSGLEIAVQAASTAAQALRRPTSAAWAQQLAHAGEGSGAKKD